MGAPICSWIAVIWRSNNIQLIINNKCRLICQLCIIVSISRLLTLCLLATSWLNSSDALPVAQPHRRNAQRLNNIHSKSKSQNKSRNLVKTVRMLQHIYFIFEQPYRSSCTIRWWTTDVTSSLLTTTHNIARIYWLTRMLYNVRKQRMMRPLMTPLSRRHANRQCPMCYGKQQEQNFFAKKRCTVMLFRLSADNIIIYRFTYFY